MQKNNTKGLHNESQCFFLRFKWAASQPKWHWRHGGRAEIIEANIHEVMFVHIFMSINSNIKRKEKYCNNFHKHPFFSRSLPIYTILPYYQKWVKTQKEKKGKRGRRKTDESKLKIIITTIFFCWKVFPIAILFLRFYLYPWLCDRRQ